MEKPIAVSERIFAGMTREDHREYLSGKESVHVKGYRPLVATQVGDIVMIEYDSPVAATFRNDLGCARSTRSAVARSLDIPVEKIHIYRVTIEQIG